MTKLNREKLYAHYKDLAENYTVIPERNSGLFTEERVKKQAKEQMAAMLVRHPELETKPEEPKEEVPKEKTKSELQTELDEKGIPYNNSDNKEILIKLIEEEKVS